LPNPKEPDMADTQPDVRVVLTLPETQTRLALGRSTIFELVRSGALPSFKIGRSRRFLAEDVDNFARSLRDAAVQGGNGYSAA
jgi:excisionase family DNA binding protein